MSEQATDVGQGQVVRGRNLRGSRLIEADLREVVVRGGELAGLDLDSPWLWEDGSVLLVNGVDVVPLVDAELNRRFPGRGLRRATDPAGLRDAWAAVERAWAATMDRAAGMPAGTLDVSVADEWSLTQTLRHLIMATDVWLGRAILGLAQPYHPAGLPNGEGDTEAYTGTEFRTDSPPLPEVLAARAERQAMVRTYLDGVDPAELAVVRPNPHASAHQQTVLSCLHTILQEEWDHLRYAMRDLDVLAAAG